MILISIFVGNTYNEWNFILFINLKCINPNEPNMEDQLQAHLNYYKHKNVYSVIKDNNFVHLLQEHYILNILLVRIITTKRILILFFYNNDLNNMLYIKNGHTMNHMNV